jgi:hypothetical protein
MTRQASRQSSNNKTLAAIELEETEFRLAFFVSRHTDDSPHF